MDDVFKEGETTTTTADSLPTDELYDQVAVAVELDTARAEQRKRKARKRFETVVFPALRLIGAGVLALAVVGHLLAVPRSDGLDPARLFTGAALLYVLLSWAALYLFHSRWPALSAVFVAGDVAVLTAAVHVTGGDQSWLFPVLLLRTVDQAAVGVRRGIVLAHLAAAAYGGLVVYLVAGGRSVNVPLELFKVLLLYGIGLCLAATAGYWERRRRRTSAGIHMARQLTQRLESRAAELESARARAEAANEAKNLFLANMSHEIRTPMNAVLGIADMLMLGEVTAEQKHWIEILRTSGGRLLNVIDNVLDYSRIEAGEMALERIQCKIGPLVEGVVSPLCKKAAGRGVELKAELDPGLPDKVLADPLRLRQVLINLVSNAVKFTEQGRVVLRVQVEENEEDSHRDSWVRLRFEVEDTGIGIEKEAQKWLFEPFAHHDVRSAGARRVSYDCSGAGLGLPIAQRLVELMGGQIAVDSRAGQGSTFHFVVPLATDEDPTLELAALIPERPVPLEEQPKVLLVEDDAVNRFVAEHLLASLGIGVEVAVNGREAVDMVARDRFEVVLMDLQMPVLDGFRATREIRRRETPGKETPIIALTAHALAGDRERCLQAGMDGYLAKPLAREELAQALSPWIEIDTESS